MIMAIATWFFPGDREPEKTKISIAPSYSMSIPSFSAHLTISPYFESISPTVIFEGHDLTYGVLLVDIEELSHFRLLSLVTRQSPQTRSHEFQILAVYRNALSGFLDLLAGADKKHCLAKAENLKNAVARSCE